MSITGQTLTNSGNGKRRELDFYPTPPEATHALMRFLDLPEYTIWEPACGDGAMSEVIKSYGHEVISTELRESGYGKGGVDFLQTKKKCNAIITNPPFNISADFIEHALDQADVVAMLLKSQYWHAKKRMPLFVKNTPTFILPLTWRPNFSGKDGGSPTMDVAWTVWLKGDNQSHYMPLAKPDLNNMVLL